MSGPSRRRSILLLAVGLAVAAVAAMTASYGPTVWRTLQQRNATLTTPAEVVGMRLDDSAQARDAADYLSTALAAGLPLDETIAAVYTDAADATRSVIVIGGAATLRVPERDLDLAIRLLTEGGALNGLHAVPAGDLGGVAKCGESPDAEVPMAICGWADHGSVVVAMFPGRSVDESAELLRALRAGIQRRD